MCRDCGHALDWHGDRAIGGCDGGWDLLQVWQRPRREGYPVAICPCMGWKS